MMKPFLSRRAFCALAASSVVFALSSHAADWPQYRGGNYDGISTEKISLNWPKNGPSVVWKVQTTDGFSSFAVGGGRAFTLMTRNVGGVGQEVCVAYDANTGRELWAAPLGIAKYGHDGGNAGTPSNKGGDGPRSTPTIDGSRVYVLSADLLLACLDAATGKIVWSKDILKDHQGKNITWKNAASPVIEGELIFVAGGGPGQALLAINKKDGSVAWKSQDDKMTHSTPAPATIHGTRQVIYFTQTGLVSVVPTSGQVLWRYDFPFQTSTAMSPIVAGDIVFCSAGYHNTAGAVKVTKSGSAWSVKELWRQKGKEFVNHWSTPVHHNGHLYGMFGFKDYGTGPLSCMELATGKIVWAREGFGPGNVTLVDGHLVALTDDGQLVVVKAAPAGYNEVSRAKVVDGKCWSTPTISNGRIFVRSTKEGVCLDVSVKAAAK